MGDRKIWLLSHERERERERRKERIPGRFFKIMTFLM